MKVQKIAKSESKTDRKLKRFPFELVIVVVVLVTHLYVAFAPTNSLLNWYTTDDAFYYFKVAQNITSGHGMTFDGINPTNGFHPLWLVVCIPIFAIANSSRILALRILVVVLMLLNAGTGVFLYRLLSKFITKKVAVIGALFWALVPAINMVTTQQGMESGLSAFFIVLFLCLAVNYREEPEENQKWWKLGLIGLVGAGVVLSRLDNIFIVGVIGLWVIFRKPKLHHELILDAIAAIACMFAAYLFRLGLHGQYVSYAITIYISILLALILKPPVFHLFGLDKEIRKFTFLQFIWRLIAAVVISIGIIGGVILLISKLSQKVIFSKSILFVDAILTLILFGGIRILRWRKEALPVVDTKIWIKDDWKKVIQEGTSFFLPIAILLGVYILWNYLSFGLLTPISGQVKQWWATLPNTVYGHKVDAIVFSGLSPNPGYGPWALFTALPNNLASWSIKLLGTGVERFLPYLFLFFLALVIILIWLCSKLENWRIKDIANRIGLSALFIGCLFQISFYNSISYPNTRVWYWVAQMLCIVIIFSIILEIAFRFLARKKVKEWIQASISGLVCVLIIINFSIYVIRKVPFDNGSKSNEFLEEIRILENSTESGSRIGMPGGGNIAYFINNRTIINLDGLMNSPDYFKALKTGKAVDFINMMKISYIYAKEYMVQESDPYAGIFKGHIEKILTLTDTDSFVLYKYYPNGY
jgi:hypothetical protein